VILEPDLYISINKVFNMHLIKTHGNIGQWLDTALQDREFKLFVSLLPGQYMDIVYDQNYINYAL
jgi:hypothetical protein